MNRMLIRWLVGVIAILITIMIVRALGIKLHWVPAWKVVLFVPLLAIINAIIGPVIRLLLLPVNCLTFGLFSFVINAGLFMIAANYTGAHVGKHELGFWVALLASLVYGILSTLVSWFVKERRPAE